MAILFKSACRENPVLLEKEAVLPSEGIRGESKDDLVGQNRVPKNRNVLINQGQGLLIKILDRETNEG